MGRRQEQTKAASRRAPLRRNGWIYTEACSKNCLRRSRRVGGDGGDSYYGSVATRSTAGSVTGRSVRTLSSRMIANKRWGGHRRNGDINEGGIIVMAGGSMVTLVATLGTGIRSSYRRPLCDMRIRRAIVVMLLIAVVSSLFLQGSVPSTTMPANDYMNSHQRKVGGGYG